MRARAAIWKPMPRITLDGDTADRMLSGYVDQLDVPPGFERVSALLHVVREEEAQRSAAVRTPIKESRSMLFTAPARLRLSGVAIAAACCLGTGTAAYAAGLPQSASDTASAILAKLGVHSQSTPSHPANHGADVSTVARDGTTSGRAHGAAVSTVASANGQSHRHTSGSGSGNDGSSSHGGAGKGSDISKLATSTAGGPDKGATVSTAASGGKSQAGRHGGGTGDSSGDSANARTVQSAHSGRRQGGSGTTAR